MTYSSLNAVQRATLLEGLVERVDALQQTIDRSMDVVDRILRLLDLVGIPDAANLMNDMLRQAYKEGYDYRGEEYDRYEHEGNWP